MGQPSGNIFNELFQDIIKNNTTLEASTWLHEKATLIREEGNAAQLNLAFAALPRKTGKNIVLITEDAQRKIIQVHPQFSIEGWTIDRLSRVWLLLQISSADKTLYSQKIESLFRAAEMNELAALYSALIFFDYPEAWQKQCVEGIRSNIGIVLEAIMYSNPYPCQYLNEQAWNQLVLKAFFTEKDVKRIIGLDERANKELASILIDYANERWAAQRSVNPQLWRLVSAFINETNFNNIEKAFNSNDINEQKAAALACYYSNYLPAKQLLEKEPSLKAAIVENKVSWKTL